MDTRKFDDLARSMAAAKSRRSVVKGLVAGVVGGIAVVGRPSLGAFAQVVTCSESDPCPIGYSCEEGVCQQSAPGCLVHADCAETEICCSGACLAIECCIDNPDPNETCPEGTSCFEGYCDTICETRGCDDGQCCCDDGSCSADCCSAPTVLPATGSGSTATSNTWVAAAAIGGAAAYVAARKTRVPEAESGK